MEKVYVQYHNYLLDYNKWWNKWI